MSDCEKIYDIADRVLSGDCSDKEKHLLDNHLKECSDCKEELAFALNIQSTLRSLPKIEVPDNFLVSLNEKLDLEDKIKEQIPVIRHKNFFSSWKKYSALTACLLLAVVLKVDVSDISDMSETDEIVIETVQTVEISQIPSEKEEVIPTVAEEQVPVEANAESKVDLSVQQMPVSQNKPKTTASKPAQPLKNESKQVKQEEAPVVISEQSEKIYVVKANTPHSSVEIPGYMDNRDNIIMVEPSAKTIKKEVKYEDYDIVVNDELLEAFSLAEMPANNVIVATPAAMSSAQNISINTEAACSVPITNHGAGSGSLLVSANDREKVEGILSKYSSGDRERTFMLTSGSYKSFIKELKDNGIEYKDYMIYTDNSNVAFQLMIS